MSHLTVSRYHVLQPAVLTLIHELSHFPEENVYLQPIFFYCYADISHYQDCNYCNLMKINTVFDDVLVGYIFFLKTEG